MNTELPREESTVEADRPGRESWRKGVLIAQHGVAWVAAIVCGAGFAALVTETLLPPEHQSGSQFIKISRAELMVSVGGVIAAGAYPVAVAALALRRKLRKRAAPLEVALPALAASSGIAVLAALALCLL